MNPPMSHLMYVPATVAALGMVGFMLLLAGQMAWLAAASQRPPERR